MIVEKRIVVDVKNVNLQKNSRIIMVDIQDLMQDVNNVIKNIYKKEEKVSEFNSKIVNNSAIVKEKLGYLYFIHSKAIKDNKIIDAVKIGITSSTVGQRIGELQTGNPNELSLVSYKASEFVYDLEKEIHKYFHPFHIKNEWFEWNDILQLFSWSHSNKVVNPCFYNEYIFRIAKTEENLFEDLSKLMNVFFTEDVKPYNIKCIGQEKIKHLEYLINLYK